MPEEIVATPGWVDERLDEVFSPLPATPDVNTARAAYAACLAASKAPVPSADMLGLEFQHCRPALHRALQQAGVAPDALANLEARLGTLEAEIAAES